MKRLFIAINIPSDTNFAAACQSLHQSPNTLDKINWIELKNLHITLKFLGNTPLDLISSIEEAIEKQTKHMAPFEISLNRIGAFGSHYRPRIIWVGAKDVCVEINTLHNKLEKSMRVLGFKPSFGNFVPHATLARIHSINDKKMFWNHIHSSAPLFNFSFEVKEIILYESILHKQYSPEYKIIKRFELNG